MSLLLGARRLCTTTNTSAWYDAVIVGSGMVGGALSCALGQETLLTNKRILVLEGSSKQVNMPNKEDVYNIRVVNLNIGSVELLRKLGVWDDITAVRVRAFDHMHVWDSCSDSAVSFDPTHSTSIGYIVENDLITAALSNRVKEHDNIEVKVGKQVVGLGKCSEDWRSVTLEDGTEIKTKLLIAADGGRSKLRQLAGMHSIGWKYDQSAVVAKLDLANADGNRTAWQRFLPTGPVALLPLTDDCSSLVWSTSSEHAEKLKCLNEEDFVSAVNAALCDYYPRSQWVDVITSSAKRIISGLEFSQGNSHSVQPPRVVGVAMDTVASYPLSFNHSVRYVQDRLVLIGDAAHTIHPLAGLGVNLGFADVITLTELLNTAVAMGADIGSPSHLLQYESIRQRHNIPIMAFVDITKRIYSTSSTVPVVLRAGLAQLVHSIKPLKELFVNQAERMA